VIGIYTNTIGLHSKVEVFILGALHGFILGGTQSSCRSLFSEMLPPGLESEFFSLYEITDKGSAWIGPLVIGAIGDWTHNKRYAFYYLAVVFVLPILLFKLIDVGEGIEEGRAYSKKYASASSSTNDE
jgi:MFS transporter, UMF1 family